MGVYKTIMKKLLFILLFLSSINCYSAMSFDGVDDTINLGNNFGFERNQYYSISVWIKRNVISVGNTIIGKIDQTNTGNVINISAGDTIRHVIQNSTGDINVTYGTVNNMNIWYHIVVTYNGSSLASGVTTYLNSVIPLNSNIASDELTAGSILNSTPCFVASRNNILSYTNAIYDNIMIYNRELSQKEVTQLYNNPYRPITNGMVGWYKLNNSANDYSGNKINGQIIGALRSRQSIPRTKLPLAM